MAGHDARFDTDIHPAVVIAGGSWNWWTGLLPQHEISVGA
jgi:hypothetical protein